LEDVIQRAALQVIEEVGFNRMTMDMVASTAKVGKAAIYRRWRSKEDLLASLLDDRDPRTVPDSGSLRGDLQLCLTALLEVLNGPRGRASRALLGVSAHEPALAEVYQRGPLAQGVAMLAEVLARATARGELTPSPRAALAAEAGAGILLQRWLLAPAPIDPALVDDVVDRVMVPLLKLSPEAPPD
jgi:AcrR family transcriptional regulator